MSKQQSQLTEDEYTTALKVGLHKFIIHSLSGFSSLYRSVVFSKDVFNHDSLVSLMTYGVYP